ncbi:MAG: Hsp20/alpha crystallin family protein [Saprospiraceae bacterium]
MNIVKVNPVFQGRTFTNLMDDVFNRSISDLVGSDFSVTTPSVNITENNDTFTLELAAPGLDKKDFNIFVDKDQLVISASKEVKNEDKEEGKWTRKEFNYTTFKRTFHLTDAVDAENINAEYNKGILTLVLPKREEIKAKAPKTIEIK